MDAAGLAAAAHALEMLSTTASHDAFDVGKESQATRDRYRQLGIDTRQQLLNTADWPISILSHGEPVRELIA
jgi:hypothetical protein